MDHLKKIAILLIIVLLGASASAIAEDHSKVVLVETSLKPGDTAPMFALPNAKGEVVRLAELLEDGPVLVFFYRGAWCPFCTTAHAKMATALPQIRELGATVVAISPQTVEYTAETVEKNKIEYYTLSDVGLKVAKQFGLDFKFEEKMKKVYLEQYSLDVGKHNGEGGWQLNVPGYYLINTDGAIAWAYANPDYKVRPAPEDIIEALKQLKKAE